jgi:hypothetical protein
VAIGILWATGHDAYLVCIYALFVNAQAQCDTTTRVVWLPAQ